MKMAFLKLNSTMEDVMEKERSFRSKEELIVLLLDRGIYKVKHKQLYECSQTELYYYYLSITRDKLQRLTTKVSL